jgi:hypothetical protein
MSTLASSVTDFKNIFKNIFAKKFGKKLAFLTQNKAKLCKNVTITSVLEMNANFFRRKLSKIAEKNFRRKLSKIAKKL